LYWQPRLKGKIADMAAEDTRMQKRQTEESAVPQELLDSEGGYL
jgi:hypothetical protein